VTLGFGVNLRFRNPPGQPVPWPDLYAQHLRMAQVAEECGFEGVVVPEHHSVDDGYNPAPFVTLAALAVSTRRLRLGTQMLLLPLHNPVLAAEEAAAVDVLSAGRLEIGLGAGYRPGDFAALGVDFGRRGSLLDEAAELFLRALTEPGAFSFEGTHFRGEGICLMPRPVQNPRPPVLLAVRSRTAARRAGRLGLSANILVRSGHARDLAFAHAEALAAAGHDPAARGITTVQDGLLADDRERARATAEPLLRIDRDAYGRMMSATGAAADRGFLDSMASDEFTPLVPDDWVRLIEQALQTFAPGPVPLVRYNISVWLPGMSFDEGRRALELFAATVMPRFR
jgi:alkanesulfonate monooxygenase SsuD/methylene tetrahydromethanopterin reductase-like flavin-dependent oxidoreductase (luciferase family)